MLNLYYLHDYREAKNVFKNGTPTCDQRHSSSQILAHYTCQLSGREDDDILPTKSLTFHFHSSPHYSLFFFCIPLPIVPNCNVMILCLSLALSSSCAPGCWSEPLLNIHKEGKGGETDEESKESHTLS